MLVRKGKKRIGDILVEEGILTEEQLEEALKAAKAENKKIGEAITDLGFATEQDIAEALSSQLGFEYVNLSTVHIPDNVLSLINESVLRKHLMIPYAFVPNTINQVKVAMVDPMDMSAIDDFSIVTNLLVVPSVATTRDILIALDRYYGDTETIKAAQEYAREREDLAAKLAEGDLSSQDVQSSPVVQLVTSMVEQAARQRASDIHIEAKEDSVRVRFRIDGSLYEKFTYSIHLLPAIMARLKIIGGMDIAEKRKPQDGRFTILVDKREYDIRVSVLPTVYGEKCVMRLAQKKALTRNKSELGFSPSELQAFDDILKNPNGILLVTGPTGSGKSTTLYTALSELNKEDVNIVTVEDPVEANIDGINQVQVNVKAELTFASALRSILRQDPDIIMIGEIRDGETAQIAVQASITGHLVVSTLHTNSAAGSINRLINMGVEGYLLADSLVGIIAQRLVRRLCPYCKKPHLITDTERRIMGIRADVNPEIYEPVGCERCDNTGYSGRIGIYEIMKITPPLKELISKNASVSELKQMGMREGMHTLRQSATMLVIKGITSVHEMIKTTFEN
ncbi:GspE/PulE family protein [Catonella massiliensis]|uniref:Flp pilus assembly complex ATPase component TadA n=1 Tax=Catonella massiliensis TaxID=2799636 RepID=A0ABS1IYV7_9FIRM|nr:ATPase, T2SS/T4P/T4SS family [Catonella massiliensis]MBK5897076.1 Flp pilus assembly complex ATPase component TadA [Catonella massiliensis]